MPSFHIKHHTKYTYESTVRDSANQLMLFPIADAFQNIMNYRLKITGDPPVETHRDYFGNLVQTFTLTAPHEELNIESEFSVITTPRDLPAPFISTSSFDPATLANQLEFVGYINPENLYGLDDLTTLIHLQKEAGMSPYDLTEYFSNYIFTHFKYIKGVTTVESTIADIWKLKAGVCQDFAHLLLVMLRGCGIPSRYVSGYICPEKNEMRGIGATHAWVEAYIPGYGWFGVDPTNNCIANEHHIRLAIGRSFNDCSPVKGTYRGTSRHKLEVIVEVNSNGSQPQPVQHQSQSRNVLLRKIQEQSQQQ